MSQDYDTNQDKQQLQRKIINFIQYKRTPLNKKMMIVIVLLITNRFRDIAKNLHIWNSGIQLAVN